jgi:hypothetical protein
MNDQMNNHSLNLILGLVSVSVLLQSFELLSLRKEVLETWRWETLKVEWPSGLGLFLSDKSFFALILLQIGMAVAAPLLSWPVVILWITTTLISMRFRGTFNGGADVMTFVVLTGLTVAKLGQNPLAIKFAFWWIALQLILSYFVAGVTKLRSKNWRDGTALIIFLNSTIYEDRPPQDKKSLGTFLSRCLILFEISFPLAMINSTCATIYIAIGLSFHLANAYFLGLNRFFWAWLAAYPALLAVTWN